jgi:hypothetical protein
MPDDRIQTYQEFWPFYLSQHQNPLNRTIHVWATTGAAIAGAACLVSGRPASVLVVIALAYAANWVGHFVIEKNRPATLRYPLWSFVSDIKMAALSHLGRLEPIRER